MLVGDSCIDEYQYGTVDRISPEAPVPVFNFLYSEERPGMVLNVKANLESHGLHVMMITDASSKKTRFIDKRTNHQLLRVDNDHFSKEPFDLKSISKNFDAVVISDYDKGFITQSYLENISNIFDGPIYVDTKKRDLGKLKGCFVKINEKERNLCISVPEEIIVTMGAKGTVYKDELYESEPVEVSDVCGAGDTFLASLVYWHLNTGDIRTAIRMANKAAAITVQHFGTYAPKLEEYV